MAKKNALTPIPHPPRTFVLGNLLSLTTISPVQDMMKLAQEYGPIYWLDMLGKPVVIVSGFDLVDELCDESRFDKSVRGALRRLRDFAGDGLFTAYTQEPNWSRAHNILLPSFGQRAMQGYHPMMLDIAEQLVLKWDRLNADDEIDVTHDMTSLTLDTIGLCGFGYRFNSFYRESPHPFVGAMIGALGTSMETRGLPLESIVKKDRERKLRADIRYMNEMVDRIVRERRESGDDLADKPDLLSHMLSGVDRKTGERLDDLNIRYQVITFLIAGHETTSGLLSFAVYYLLNNPDVLARASAEVDRVLGPDPGVLPTYAQVNQLAYLEQILKESLRLWPTAPVFALSPYKDEMIGGLYRMRKNYQIVVLSPMLHRDRKVWGEQADVFNPDNFSREAERQRPANAYKPFGNGQRACIGRQFALQEAALVLGMILQRFKLIDHTRYRLTLKETLTVKPDQFRIKVRRRTDRDRAATGRAVATTSTGAAVAARVAPAARASRPGHQTPLHVLYGSNLGTAEEVARRIAEAGEGQGFAVTVASLDEYAGRLPREGAVLITTASYNGTPPDNAGRFCDWLRDGGLAPGALAGVRYAVFGCGNRDWAATFQAIPRLIDARLEALGAQRLHQRGEGDARDDFDAQFEAWQEPLWGAVATTLGVELTPAEAAEPAHLTVEIVAGPDAGTREDGHGARPMRVAVNRELHAKAGPFPSERSTRHLELELPTGVAYRAGDHLGVAPRNPDALVARVTARFGLDPASHVILRRDGGRPGFLPVDTPTALARLLGDYLELQDIASRRHIQAMVEHTECSVDAATPGRAGRRRGALQGRGDGAAPVGAGSPRGISRLPAPVQHVPRDAPASSPALLLDLVVPAPRPASLQHHGGGGDGGGAVRPRGLRGRVLESSPPPRGGKPCPGVREGHSVGIPPPRRSGNAHHHDRPGHRPGPVPRLRPGARRARRPGPPHRPRASLLRLPASRAGLHLRGGAARLRRAGRGAALPLFLARARPRAGLRAGRGPRADGRGVEAPGGGRGRLRLRRRHPDGARRSARLRGHPPCQDGGDRRAGGGVARRSRRAGPVSR